MAQAKAERPVATLWQVAFADQQLSCVVYRRRDGLRLEVESPEAVIVSEPFDMQPRALARAQALRDALLRRGWNQVR
jgi:hypothetical protein